MTSSNPGVVTLAEIRSQATVWREAPASLPDVSAVDRLFGDTSDGVVLTGCGSSYYLALAATAVFRQVRGGIATAAPASEVLHFPKATLGSGRRGVLVAISRSGETSETVAAARLAATRGLSTLAITCYPTSTLAGVCDRALSIAGGQEQSVVMTRSFTGMLTLLQRLAGLLAGDTAFLDELVSVARSAGDLGYAEQSPIAETGRDSRFDSLVYLGSGPLFGIAEEAALKVKEMSLTQSIAYRPLEFRHGPISVVGESTLAVVLASEAGREHEKALVEDLKAKGASVLAIGEDSGRLGADWAVDLSAGFDDFARQALYLPPLQMLAYYRSLAKGLDPDAPKNLTQVVRLDWSR